MMRIAIVLAAMGFLAVSTSAQAALLNLNVLLDGSQENPSNASAGTSTATVTFNTVTGDMNVSGTFSGLGSNVTAAHVHGYAAAGVNAGVVFGLTIDTGVTSGNFSGSHTFVGGDITNVLNDLTYINIHTTGIPGGEIRGQIVVPEPASAALLTLAAAPLLLRRKRA